MGRICAVKTCPTRTDKNFTARKAGVLQSLAFFSIPKRNNALHAWSRAVRQRLSASDCICELHFANTSVIKEDRIMLANGDVHVLPRQKAKLKEYVQPLSHDKISSTENAFFHVYASSNRQNPAPEAFPVGRESQSGLKATTLSNKTETRRESADARMDSSGSSMHIQPQGVKEEHVTLDQESARKNYKNVPEKSFGNDFASRGDSNHQCRSSWSSDVKNEEIDEYIIVKPCDEEPRMPFTIDNIMGRLSVGWMPERWSWMRNPKEESSIIFIQIDAYTLVPRQQLILRNDLSITVCTGDGKVSYKLEQLAKSIETIKILLYEHGKTIICGGTGHEDKTRSNECCGFMSPNEYRKFVQTPRCIDCRQLRQKLQTRYNRSKADVNMRYAPSKHAVRMEPPFNATIKIEPGQVHTD